MKNSKQLLIIGILSLFSQNIFAKAAELQEFSSRDYSFCQQATPTDQSTVFSVISFSKKAQPPKDAGLAAKHSLYVGAHFSVDRPISTFTHEKLLTPADIAHFSDSDLTDVKATPASLDFQSTKSVGPGGLTKLRCSNTVQVFTFEDFLSQSKFSNFGQKLDEESCFPNKPPKLVSVQRVAGCNSYFNSSTIITFYGEVQDTKTRIVSFTFSSLTDKPNFLTRPFMVGEVEDNLEALPRLIKEIE